MISGGIKMEYWPEMNSPIKVNEANEISKSAVCYYSYIEVKEEIFK